MNVFYGIKKNQTQAFDEQGRRVVVTKVTTKPCTIVQLKDEENDGYRALQVGIGEKKFKNVSRSLQEKFKKAGFKEKAPLFLREIKLKGEIEEQLEKKLKIGEKIAIQDFFEKGDQVMVQGKTKGKGFSGVVKRWGMTGGRRTHGSDSERRVGSIGQTTDPGRVWKGKKMPGRQGGQMKTIKGIEIFKIDEKNNEVWISGLLPGGKNNLLKITKVEA